MKRITPRHRRFVEQYCTHFVGARAAREAGYSESRAKRTAYDLLQDEDIQEMVSERLDEMSMSAAEATRRLTKIAEASVSDYFQITEKDGQRFLTLDKEAILEDGYAIKELSWDTNGRPKLKLHDSVKTLESILEAHGAFNHTHEHEHSGELGLESDTLEEVMDTIADRATRLGSEEDDD